MIDHLSLFTGFRQHAASNHESVVTTEGIYGVLINDDVQEIISSL